jgi:hypothetical protein
VNHRRVTKRGTAHHSKGNAQGAAVVEDKVLVHHGTAADSLRQRLTAGIEASAETLARAAAAHMREIKRRGGKDCRWCALRGDGGTWGGTRARGCPGRRRRAAHGAADGSAVY